LPKGSVTFLLLGASFRFLESSQHMNCADGSDPYISFQTNTDKIKSIITKFPERPAEEGAPEASPLFRLGEPYPTAYVEPAFLRRPRQQKTK
jgi:hypothetical protein